MLRLPRPKPLQIFSTSLSVQKLHPIYHMDTPRSYDYKNNKIFHVSSTLTVTLIRIRNTQYFCTLITLITDQKSCYSGMPIMEIFYLLFYKFDKRSLIELKLLGWIQISASPMLKSTFVCSCIISAKSFSTVFKSLGLT